jgi:arginine deiminase
MIFTFVDEHACVVYPPLILNEGELDVFHIYLKDEKTELISQRRNLLAALAEVNIEVEPIACGGNDALSQAREQWQSGANFFSIAPGKMIGYDRNPETLKELNRHGYPTVMAKDIIAGDVDIGQMDRFVVAISSSELVRGGGGCRCMTMPVLRQDVHEA